MTLHRESLYADPYTGNPLTAGLKPIPDTKQILSALLYLPPKPSDMGAIPKHIRLHHLMSVRDLHIPPLAERQLFQTVDMMVRQGYRYRDPRLSSSWSLISGESVQSGLLIPQASGAIVEGISGVGKTQACYRCLQGLGRQTIFHESFPQVMNGLQQVVWLSIEAPASGKAEELARALMLAWQEATKTDRFDFYLSKDRIGNGIAALNEWLQVARSHFLGVLHIDEIQNLFKLMSLRTRKSSTGSRELSIVEDKVLLWILSITNTGKIPLLISGTPDGVGALAKRLSTLQRMNTGGYHPMIPFQSATDKNYYAGFLQPLFTYQYVRHPLTLTPQVAKVILDLSGGIPRILIALWIAAHRVAFERTTDDLRLEDFETAARTWLAPLAPAVAALRSHDPDKMRHYEDLVPNDALFWANFWVSTQATEPTP